MFVVVLYIFLCIMTQLEKKSASPTASKWMGRMKVWASYYSTSRTIYQTQHSSIFDFYTKVLRCKQPPKNRDQIEQYRQKFLQSTDQISTKNEGAGSFHTFRHESAKISELAQYGISPSWKCRILSHLVSYSNAGQILELGTSLGIMAAYLANAGENRMVTTIDSNVSMIEFSQSWHRAASYKNIRYLNQNFENGLTQLIEEKQAFDLIFLDGHHDGQATKSYIDTLLSLSHDHSIIVLDDVLWSEDMYQNWQEIRLSPQWKASMQFGDLGFLFCKKHPISNISMDLIPYRYKPWQIGIFQY